MKFDSSISLSVIESATEKGGGYGITIGNSTHLTIRKEKDDLVLSVYSEEWGLGSPVSNTRVKA